jgi:cytochrome c-type biogenesis protein CcmH/NrfF
MVTPAAALSESTSRAAFVPVPSKTIQKACLWAGPVMGLLFVVGFLVAGFFPPPSPNQTAAEVAAMINRDRTAIRIGIVLCLASCTLLMPFQTMFTIQMRRIEGVRPVLAYTQLALGALATIEFVIPYVFMLVSTYRSDTDPDVTRALFDLSWFFFLGVISTFVLQLAIFGVAVLVDRRPKPVFPRWLGYLNLWLAVTFTPASFLVFFKTGPLAWNGVFVWWVPVTAFLLWFVPNFVCLLRAVDEDDGVSADREGQIQQRLDEITARLQRLETGPG